MDSPWASAPAWTYRRVSSKLREKQAEDGTPSDQCIFAGTWLLLWVNLKVRKSPVLQRTCFSSLPLDDSNESWQQRRWGGADSQLC